MTLFRRKIALTVNQTKVEELQVDFEVVKSLAKEPNTLSARVYNLSQETREKWTALNGAGVQLDAGYEEGGYGTIFLGKLEGTQTTIEGPDRVTVVEATDGRYEQSQRISKSYGPGTSVETVARDLIKYIGKGVGNVIDKLRSGAESGGLANTLKNGFVVDGRAFDELDKLARSRGLEASIQDGRIQLLGKNLPNARTAYKLTPETGLIASPSVDSKKILKCKTLLIPDIVPGRQIVVDSDFVKGSYRVIRVTYTGSLYGSDFYCAIEGKSL